MIQVERNTDPEEDPMASPQTIYQQALACPSVEDGSASLCTCRDGGLLSDSVEVEAEEAADWRHDLRYALEDALEDSSTWDDRAEQHARRITLRALGG